MADYYELLQVLPTASVDEIRAAYRRSASPFHPDRNPGNPLAAAKFQEISRAYDILSDQNRRRAYDSGRRGGAENLIDTLVGDLESALAVFGQVSSMFEVPPMKKRSECTTCNGSGEAPLDLGLIVINRSCPDCEEEKPSTVAGDRP